jgi:ribosomal protein S18 acetylase RimI-like enzyme
MICFVLVADATCCFSSLLRRVSCADKMAECRHPDARYLVVTQVQQQPSDAAAAPPASSASSASPAAAAAAAVDADGAAAPASMEGEPVGFVSFRYTTGDDDHAPLLYVYELQLESSVHRQGLGKHLMSLVELLAWKCQLLRVVLTVFARNEPAMRLYTRTLHYDLDDTDPSLHDERAPYSILAKRSPKIKSIADIVLPASASAAAAAGAAT